MVIYDSIDSDNLMNAMSANLKNAKELFSRLTKGSAHLVEVVDSGVLSSAANTAGRDLFKAYIDPMIQNLSKAIDDIESDLTTYRTAEGTARQHDSHLDEALLKKQLDTTKKLIRLLQKKIDDDKDLMKNLELAKNGEFSTIGDNLGKLPALNAQLDNLEDSKKIYEQQIEALKTFESSTTPLFTDSLQAFKYALQGVDVINQTKASVDGNISFPAGADMSWSSKLQGQKFSSGLAKEKQVKKESKIEIKTREIQKEPNGMYPDANYLPEVVYEVYVNGVLDKEKSETLNWMMKKQALLGSLHTVGDFILVNDIYRLATGKDWLSGDKANRLEAAGWLGLTALPASKLSKIAKELKAGNKLLKGVDLTEQELKVLNEAGYFDDVKGSEALQAGKVGNDLPISEGAANHLANVEKFSQPKGISGGHNAESFYEKLDEVGGKIISETSHSSIPGIKEVKYEIPKKNADGSVKIPPEYKVIKESKTIYDPNLISDEQMYRWGQEAMNNGEVSGPNGEYIKGIASNGLKFEGFYRNGEITNFFPTLK